MYKNYNRWLWLLIVSGLLWAIVIGFVAFWWWFGANTLDWVLNAVLKGAGYG